MNWFIRAGRVLTMGFFIINGRDVGGCLEQVGGFFVEVLFPFIRFFTAVYF